MPERPLLRLPDPEPFILRQRGGGGNSIARPTRDRQRERLDPRFSRLTNIARSPDELWGLRADPASIAPERAIVFEVEGSLTDFYAQARELGLEYLGDFEEEFDPSGDFYVEGKPGKRLTGRIYLAMPDVRALQELLSLWERFKAGERMPTGKGPWRELFSQLIDVRPWGPQDRVDDEAIAFWEEELARAPGEPVRVEIELWFHESPARRRQAFQQVEQEIAAAGGTIIHHAMLPEIRYDAALVDIPARHVRDLIDHAEVNLARADEVMFLRPQSVAYHPGAEEFEGEDNAAPAAAVELASPEPVAALFDGLPIENHVRLAGRLIVDDPEGLEAAYPVNRREHGTEMASLIIHGDLNLGGMPLSRPLYVRPVLNPTDGGGERTPADRLLVDVIHQAVRRIKEGDGDEAAAAPTVVAINLSICDPRRPFARTMSPLGRLLDYLSWRYGVLFFVSAGNITDRLPVSAFRTSAAFEAATPEQREQAILQALNDNKSQRTLYSPAESLNALTVGAAHAGSAFNGALPNGRFDPFVDERLPNIVSAMGLGYKKAVKPELLFAGGRAPVRIAGAGDGIVIEP
jgi:hypothetical protein